MVTGEPDPQTCASFPRSKSATERTSKCTATAILDNHYT